MKVVLFHGRGLVSGAIRWFTRGDYSHAAILLDNGELWESWQGSGKHLWRNSGVRCLKGGLKAGTDGVYFYLLVNPLSIEEETRLREWLVKKEGTNYDYKGVWRFVTRSRKTSDAKMFCSDLVVSGLMFVERLLFNETASDEVSPDLLKRSLALLRE